MSGRRKKKKGKAAAVVCRIFGTLILILVIGSLLPITVPRFMGYEVYNVISGSMEPEIPVGSVVYVEPVDPSTLTEGDMIAFISGGSVVIHRVVTNHLVDQDLVTKGDANEQEDLSAVPYPAVRGQVVRHYPVLGQLMMVCTDVFGKILLLCLALSGVLLHVAAGRMQQEEDQES